ncbi:hypothetical protein Lal_00007436 [Lupinus albus]|nr:hypothetical protein Lal_00007436 [Lupinus albus]
MRIGLHNVSGACFCCMLVDNNNNFRVDELEFMQMDLKRSGYKDEPFILAAQAQQIFYVSDPTNKKWFIVLLTNKIILNNIDDKEDIDVEYDLFLDIIVA